MRLPTTRVFTSPKAARCRGALFGCAGRAVPQLSALALGMDVSASENLASSLRMMPQERFPPFLVLIFLGHCWTTWMVSSWARKLRGRADDAADLETLLAVSERSLCLYSQGENGTEEIASKHAGKHGVRMATTDRNGYHHIVKHMLCSCAVHLTIGPLLSLMRYAVAVEDSEGVVLEELVGLLLSVSGDNHEVYITTLRNVLSSSLPIHVAPIVLSVLRQKEVSTDVVKLCMHHVAVVVRGRQVGVPVETAISGFHECAVTVFQWLMSKLDWDHECGDLCIQVMSCLKYAPAFLLCDVYCSMEKHKLVTPSVQCKFLANCGIATSASGSVPRECTETIVRAFRSLAGSKTEVRHIEEGLVHGSAALIVMRREELVRNVYAVFPSLRETPHSVMAYALSGDIERANKALLRLARSREEGWINVPSSVSHAIHTLCLLVGRSGSADDMIPLYRALVSFHNPGMIVSQCVEYVLAGICDRVSRLERMFLENTPPRIVLDHVIPPLRAATMCLGDDFNTDMILDLLETAVTQRYFAVPLTASIIWTLRGSSSLALKELFFRVDASTNNIPFLSYYTLCYARDRGRRETVEHLAVVWSCDSDPILKRHSSLAPLFKLWKCSACGRLNSDRFNYCVCSSLRNGFVVCVRCSHAQDERWTCCQLCGERMSEDNIAAAVVRRSWSCDECGANNPARQVVFCFRCKALSGPVAKLLKKLKRAEVTKPCLCSMNGDVNKVGFAEKMRHYCRDCGWFQETWASANTTVWYCEGCDQLRSSLDRICPDCPQVDCLPFAILRPARVPLFCSGCRLSVNNPFAVNCFQCDAVLSTNSKNGEGGAAVEASAETQSALWCSRCGNISLGDTLHSCTKCEHQMHDAKLLQVASRCCDRCGGNVPLLHIGAVCSQCAAFLPPVPKEGWSVAVVHETLSALVGVMGRDSGSEELVPILQEILNAFLNDVTQVVIHETRIALVAAVMRVQGGLGDLLAHSASARRAVALGRQLLEHADTVCGDAASPPSLRFSDGECRNCLGSHVMELCAYGNVYWMCDTCGAENSNVDVCRYVCCNCLALRSCVQEVCPTEVWECLRCQRGNIEFEDFCIFCGEQRAAAERMVEESTEVYPFLPGKCSKCDLVYLEAWCPLCHNDVRDSIKKAEGVVCFVTNRYAFIQPAHTDHPNQRVYVGEPWLRRRRWVVGEKVTFTARLNQQGGFRLTSLHI